MDNTNYFLLRRLHSLLGVFPLGIFLFNHLLTNSTLAISMEFFEHKVALIHSLGPLLPFVEAGFIFIPLAIHIGLGVYIALQSRIEIGAMNYGRNWAYAFQRWTGWIALAYIAYHVIHLRFLHDMAAEPFSITLAKMFTIMPFAAIIVPAYIIGGLAVVYHFANGLCTFCMSWGITVGPKSQQLVARAAIGVGAVLTLMLLTGIGASIRHGLSDDFRDGAKQQALVEKLQSYHNGKH
jgi:succinate dehydrogenase / fumarate reductase cytochrome b subunit